MNKNNTYDNPEGQKNLIYYNKIILKENKNIWG